MFFGIDGSLDYWCICNIKKNQIKISIQPNIEKALKFINPNNLTFIDIPIGLSSKKLLEKLTKS